MCFVSPKNVFISILHVIVLYGAKRGKNQQDTTVRYLLSTSVSTRFGHRYAHLQENKDRVTAYGVLRWFCWLWLVAVVRRCVVGCVQCEGYCIWCVVLVLLDVVGSGCEALRCRMRAV